MRKPELLQYQKRFFHYKSNGPKNFRREYFNRALTHLIAIVKNRTTIIRELTYSERAHQICKHNQISVNTSSLAMKQTVKSTVKGVIV